MQKKTLRTILSMFICLTWFINCFVPNVYADNVISSSSIEAAIAYGYNIMNTSPSSYSGYCAAFVWKCYNAGAKIGNSSYATARQMGDALITNTDANPPRGAFVFWYDSYGPSTKAGHVALSLGDGKIIHAYSNVKVTTIETVNNSHYIYRGWGAPKPGYRLETDNVSPPTGAWIWSDKNVAKVGEEISFNYNAENATNYVLAIDKVGVGRVDTIDTGTSDWHTMSFSESGTYKIYASCYNSASYCDSPVMTLVVYEDIGDDFYAIILHNSSWKIIEVCDDTRIRLGREDLAANELWKFNKNGDGTYTITTAKDGRVLEVLNGSSENNTPVKTWDNYGGSNEKWYIYKKGAGDNIVPQHAPTMTLDVPNGNTDDGTQINIYSINSGDNQVFAIYRGSGNEVNPAPAELWVNPGNSQSDTTLTWSIGRAANTYHLKVWKDKIWEGESVLVADQSERSYSVTLPAGTYEAYVDSINHFGVLMSNVVHFDVEECIVDYMVNFDANGGYPSMDNKIVTHGSTYGDLPEPTRKGYTFTGWFTAADGGTQITKDTTVSITEDQTLYAQWDPYTYTIEYNANGGIGATEKSIHRYDSEKALTKNDFTKKYHAFKEWNTKPDGSGDSYADEAEVKNLTTENDKIITLYAQWQKTVDTATTLNDHGSYTLCDVKINGATAPCRVILAAYKGNKLVSAETKTYSSDSESFAVVEDFDTIKVMVWDGLDSMEPISCEEISKIPLSIYFDANGGTVSPENKQFAMNTAIGELPVPSRDYYSFTGWYTERDGGEKVTEKTVMRSTTDITLYAHWVQNDVSGWTLASELPAGAEVVNRKWTYTLTSYTTSDSPSLSGWDRYDSSSSWSDYGDWSAWQDGSVSESDSRQVETQSVISGYNKKTQWIYSRARSKSGRLAYGWVSGDCTIVEGTGWLDYPLEHQADHSCGPAYGKGFRNEAGESYPIYWYNEATQEVDDYNSPIYKTQYRYRDRNLIYTYYYKRDEVKESEVDPSGQSNISNVKEYVQYRMK